VCQVAGADKTVAKADADNASARPPIGVVHEIRGTDAVVALNGEVAAGLTGLTRGTAYWLSTTAGALVATKPATNAYLVGVAVSASELLVNTVAADLVIGGGGGSVTSFGVTSSDITVSNSPITSSGVIDLALNTVPVSKGGTGLTSATEQGASLIASSSSAYVAQATSLSWRNRIINGDMRVAQRGTAAVTYVLNDVNWPVDRWRTGNTVTTGGATVQYSTDAPSGFASSLLSTVTSTGSPAAAQALSLIQLIEGSNIYDFGYGTASAKTITLSFWVKASLQGTYCVSLRGGSLYSYVAEVAVTASWQRKTITIPGPALGVWPTNNINGLTLAFALSSASTYITTPNAWVSGNYIATANQVNFLGTSGATFQITGVQLEVGSVATPFEVLPYEKQLELCQRYYARLSSLSGNNVGFGAGVTFQGASTSPNAAFVYLKYPQQMRATPTVAQSGTGVYNTAIRTLSSTSSPYYGSDSLSINLSTATNTQTVGQGVLWTGNSSTAYIELNAEL
jgi:hypothetical protein